MTMRVAIAWLFAASCGTGSPQKPEPATQEPAPAPAPASAPAPVAKPEPEPEPTPEPPPTIRGEVVLIALGDFPVAHLDAVESHLRTHAAVNVRRLDPIPLPRE